MNSPVWRAAHVRRTPEQAFSLFTEQIGAWWPLPTHGLFGAESASVGFEGGVLVERSCQGERIVWGTVLVWEPPTRLVMTWHPGRPDAPAGEVTVLFTPDDDGTLVEVRHGGWAAFGPGAGAARGNYIGPNAWGAVLDHFTDLADRPDREPLPALHSLRAAYEAFFAEAARGGFGPPPPQEWTAAQVVAHMAVNDELLAGVCRLLITSGGNEGPWAEGGPRLENLISNDLALLVRRVEDQDGEQDLPRLIAHARAGSERLCLLIGRLDEEHLDTEVHARLVDHGDIRVDRPLSWGSLVLEIQTAYHLPSHTAQLVALRSGESSGSGG